MAKRKPKSCSLCGVPFRDDAQALAHKLVAHPPQERSRRKRVRRVQNALVKAHDQLEQAGFSEVQAHLVIEVMARELRKAGVI